MILLARRSKVTKLVTKLEDLAQHWDQTAESAASEGFFFVADERRARATAYQHAAELVRATLRP